jgi:hypothetical protein
MSRKITASLGCIFIILTITYVNFLKRHYYESGATGLSAVAAVTLVNLGLCIGSLLIVLAICASWLRQIKTVVVRIIAIIMLTVLLLLAVQCVYFLVTGSWFFT